MMKQILLVGLGGFIGSIGRYKLSGLILHHTIEWRFPLATFAVNVVGCFIIGLLAGLSERHTLGADLRVFLFPGILGGFTTFSAFGYETFFLVRRGESLIALLYVALSMICGLIMVWFAFKIGSGKA
jgi:CrcB protein